MRFSLIIIRAAPRIANIRNGSAELRHFSLAICSSSRKYASVSIQRVIYIKYRVVAITMGIVPCARNRFLRIFYTILSTTRVYDTVDVFAKHGAAGTHYREELECPDAENSRRAGVLNAKDRFRLSRYIFHQEPIATRSYAPRQETRLRLKTCYARAKEYARE